MFFLGLIVTVTDKERVVAPRAGEPAPLRPCLACGRETPHRAVEVCRQLALFFIPVWRWNRRYLLVCQTCGCAEEAPSGRPNGRSS
jgi:hypothetical protein